MARSEQPRGKWAARRDLLWISLSVVALVWLLAATDVFEPLVDRLHARFPGSEDEILAALALTLLAVGLLSARGWYYGRRASEGRRDAEERYRTLVEQLPAITYIEDPDGGRYRYISPGIEAILGYSTEEWTTDPTLWERTLHPDDRARVLAEDAADTGDEWSTTYRAVARDGHVVWLQNHAVLVRDADGQPRFWQGVAFDITDLKRAEERVHEAETNYRTLVEQLPVVVYQDAVDDLSTAVYISPQYERMFGFPPEARLHDPEFWVDHLHPDDRERVLELSRWTNETGESFSTEYRFLSRDGRYVWVRDEAVLVRDTDGRPTLWQGVLFDVTARKRAEEQQAEAEHWMHEAQQRYRGLVENLPGATYIDPLDDSNTLYVSPQIEAMFGYTPEEWTTEPHLWLEALHPEDRDRVWAAVERHNVQGEPFDQEYRMRTKDGRWVWVRDYATVVSGESGGSAVSQGVMFDVTERRKAEEALREAEERFRAIVEHVPAAIYVDAPDASMTSLYVSPQVEKITGWTAEQYLSEPELWLNHMGEPHREELRRSYLEAISRGESWMAEYPLRTPDGREVWIHDETTFVRDENGQALFLQGVLFDITERKLAEQALAESERREREAAERLRALDEMKNNFLAAVSHELRSPLTSILGLSLTLEQQQLPASEQTDLLSRLATNARKLDGLLRDLLDIDRLSRGIVTSHVRPTDIGAVVDRIVENLDVLDSRSILVETESILVPADAPKVERIVENLVMNAVRHTGPDVGIWVRVFAQDGGAVVAIEDDGLGVPPDLQREIFEPFRQGPTASPHNPGTGIGLSLVAMFADLHGGRAWVQEREGGGASFRVFLPGEREDAPQANGSSGGPNGHGSGPITPVERAAAG